MPLRLTKLPTSPNWYIRGTVRGVRVFETTGTDVEAVADEIRIRREALILEESIHGRKQTRPFAEAALSYIEAGGEARFLGEEKGGRWTGLIGHFMLRPIRGISQADLDAAAKTILPNASADTRNRQCYTPFIAVWNHAAKREWCDQRTWERPRLSKGRSRWATYQEAGAILLAAPLALERLLMFLMFTGARSGEALALRWDDVDVHARWAVLRDTKNGENRGIPLHPDIVEWMRGVKDRSGTVFRSARRNAEYVEREGGGRFKTGWRKTLYRAGLEGVDLRPHDLRHTCSTWLTMAGVHEQVRDELLGHASSDMGRRYSHIPRPSLIEAVDKLPRREDLVNAVGPGTATIRKRLRKGEQPATLVRERS